MAPSPSVWACGPGGMLQWRDNVKKESKWGIRIVCVLTGLAELEEKLAQTVSSYDQTLQQKTQELEQYVDRQVRNYSSGQLDSAVIDQIAAAVVQQMGGASGGSAVWAVVQIPAGGRVILRSGAAVCAAAGSPGLVDLSDAETLENGKGLQANHLYIINAEGRGFTSAQGCSVLIAGDYTIA